VKVLIWVDDILMRGVKDHTDVVWVGIDKRFGLKEAEYLESGVERVFLGVTMMKSQKNGKVVYCMHQNNDMASFLSEQKIEGPPLKSPMRDRKDLYLNDTPASAADVKWFRSVLMSCSYYACWSRLDIATPVNRLAQKLAGVTVSAVDELKRLLRCLTGRPNFTLVATRPETPSNDVWEMYVDSDLAGEAPQDTKICVFECCLRSLCLL